MTDVELMEVLYVIAAAILEDPQGTQDEITRAVDMPTSEIAHSVLYSHLWNLWEGDEDE